MKSTTALLMRLSVLTAVLLTGIGMMVGCADRGDALSTPQGRALLKTQQIIQKSGGDWSRLSTDDQQYLVNGPGGGSEATAKSFLVSDYARMSYHPGTPPPDTNVGPPPRGPAKGAGSENVLPNAPQPKP